jgi:Putative Flp pilus-assembly TadE/G-like
MITHRREEGAVAIMVALLLVVFMAAVALTVDVGGLYLRRRALVNGSDAAAMGSARTCTRGGNDVALGGYASPEDAADFLVQHNAPITTDEVNGPDPNITYLPDCSVHPQWGHISVRYTSNQGLYFAPVLGFDHESPVTTSATASWGLGSNNPIPIVLSSLLSVDCPVPPSGWPTPGDTCAFWYDNDRLNGGNFAFLSLNPAGWDVPIGDNCSGAQSGGTSNLTKWINGSLPASVTLNWTDPTYVCTDTGIRGVGGKGGPNSQVWSALNDLIGETRDFPINWEGPGAPPIDDAPPQGTVYQQGNIDKYDIIGFASLTIVDVVSRDDAEGGVGNCTTKNPDPYHWTTTGQTLDLNTIDSSTSGWQGCPNRIADDITSVTVTRAKNNDPPCCAPGVDYQYDPLTRTITWLGTDLPKDTKISFAWLIDPNNGPCGQLPSNSSAMCVVTTWVHSTLDSDFPPGTDNNTVIRLCDFDYGTCLDQ